MLQLSMPFQFVTEVTCKYCKLRIHFLVPLGAIGSGEHHPQEKSWQLNQRTPEARFKRAADEELLNGTPEDWVTWHKEHLTIVYLSAKNHLEAAATYWARHQPKAIPILPPGTLVYRRNHPQGRHKIQDAWHYTVFEVLECLDDGGRVYRIKPQSAEGPYNNIHRSKLKPIPARPGPLILPNIEAHLPSDTSLEEEEEPSDEESGVIAQWVRTSADHGSEDHPEDETPSPCNRPTASESPPSPVELVSHMTSPTLPVIQLNTTPGLSVTQVRHSTRRTAGHHSNPFNLLGQLLMTPVIDSLLIR
ncbi:hypothetical protein SKAU_G00342510 [Synaphobranchus kaupii]|uniref:Uncharacterized protein n=1 Tax=Synaphobranchus kaupii TaxID=118154 RepID=A0A9Q1EN92_SYNKA|nr:hypothetical protein SKAU_G00342510 [Synaphobranchus kaupii]